MYTCFIEFVRLSLGASASMKSVIPASSNLSSSKFILPSSSPKKDSKYSLKIYSMNDLSKMLLTKDNLQSRLRIKTPFNNADNNSIEGGQEPPSSEAATK